MQRPDTKRRRLGLGSPNDIRRITSPAFGPRKLLSAASAGLLLACLLIAAAAAATGPNPKASTQHGVTMFVDCSRPTIGNGSQDQPFNSLSSVNALTLTPDEAVLFKRGTTCHGTLAPHGNGAPGRRILIGAYGTISRPLPAIVALTTETAAVTLADMSHVVIQSLALRTPFTSATTTLNRQGLLVTASTGLAQDVVAQKLNVSEVVASTRNQDNDAGGIIFEAMGPSGGFDGITVRDNVVHDLSNNGITVAGRPSARPPANQPWVDANTKNVLVTHNIIRRVAGNGIIVLNAEAPVSSWNEVDAAGMADQGPYTDPSVFVCNVGLWFWDTDNAVAEHNYVHNMVFQTRGANSGCDGEAFDMDSTQDNTLYQYNVSYDNVNAVLVAAQTDSLTGLQHRATFRYNLSIDDKSIMGLVPDCPNMYSPTPDQCSGTGIQIYNNTYISPHPTTLLENNEAFVALTKRFFGSMQFKNNIVVATGRHATDEYFYCGNECSNNLFYGMPVPSEATHSINRNPQFLGKVGVVAGLRVAGALKVAPTSPATCAGIAITRILGPAAKSDFFGVKVKNPPTIGFAQASCARS